MPFSYGDELDKEVAVTVAQFVLKPDIPEEEKAYFQRFYVMFSKIAALGNIQRQDILTFKFVYKMVALLLENGIYDYAHELMGDFLMTLQLTRSVEGFWTLYGQRGVERTEQIQRLMERTKSKNWKEKLKGAFGGKGEPEPGGYGL
jgi:hypothetical protein